MQISAIIPVYNAAPYLNKSIQSVLKQEQISELFLIDDHSTDESFKICKSWEKKDSRVKVLINDGTKGPGTSRNVGLKKATHEFIAFLDADDYYLDQRFSYDQVLFKRHSTIDFVTNSVLVQSFETNMKKLAIGINSNKETLSIEDYFDSNGIHLNGLTIKKKVFYRIGLFDESLKQGEDKEIILRILQKSVGCCTANIVAFYRLHNNNSTNNYCETVYYRRKLHKKLICDAVRNKYSLKFLLYMIRHFVAYDYIWLFGFNSFYHHLAKIMLLPLFLIRIFSKDPDFTNTKTIYHI